MMNLGFIHFVDRWVGIPICFVLTLFARLGKFIGSTKRAYTGKPHKILFIEITEMGTAIVAHSSLRRAQELFPSSELYFLIFDNFKDSVHILDMVPRKNVWTLHSHSFFLFAFDTLKLLVKCRLEGIDTIVDLEFFSRYTAILSYLSGARRRSGFHRFSTEGLYRGNLFTHRVAFNRYVHTAQAYLPLVEALAEKEDSTPFLKRPVEPLESIIQRHPKLSSSAESKKVVWNKLKACNPKVNENNKIVIVNANSSDLSPLRRWPLLSYASLIKKILQDKNLVVALTGTSSETVYAEKICSVVQHERCINFTGKTTLRELIDLYNISEVMITNDSGPVHFASLTKIKLFVFLGPETPIRYSPLTTNYSVFYSNFACSPCITAENGLQSPCSNNLCLKTITVDDVYKTVKRAL